MQAVGREVGSLHRGQPIIRTGNFSKNTPVQEHRSEDGVRKE